MTQPSVFVVDDDPAMRDSLVTLLRGEGFRARAFSGGEEFLEQKPEDRIGCVVTDIRMPRMDGVELVERLAADQGRTWSVIVMTGHADVPLAVQLMKSGVVDFIEKPFDPHRMLEAVRGCVSTLAARAPEQAARDAALRRVRALTPRERQVFDALIQGRSNKEIALDLDISPRTVEIFRAKVMQKMEAQSLSALVRMGLLVGEA